MPEFCLFTIAGIFFSALCGFIKRYIEPIRPFYFIAALLALAVGALCALFAKLKYKKIVNY